MPPRKKPKHSSSSNKPISSQSHPSKFGIQHFFHLHSQNALLASQTQNPNPNPNPNPILDTTPPHLSPQLSKSVSLHPSKFSPRMLINQSQDDGGDEITWKISPVNERLHSFTNNAPQIFQLLSDSSNNLNSLTFRPCSFTKISNGASLLTPQGNQTSVASTSNAATLNCVNPVPGCADNGSGGDVNCSAANRQSPFRTPPSLSYCHEKLVNDANCNAASEQVGIRQHKKALLELLDEVEDAISIEDSASKKIHAFSSDVGDKKGDGLFLKTDPTTEAALAVLPENITGVSSNHNFLVLEVAEKHQPANSLSAKGPYKVLRLLNEQTEEERSVYLWQEWFYSVIAPGDTVNVLGEFDDQGKCDVDRDNNLIIVHPDILVSGTRVASSFTCSRRTVLDERLKFSEHSVAALTGTLLHQLFQIGLLKENPTIQYLEEEARIVLQKNLEALFACQVAENDILKTMNEAIPKLLNWIIQFKDLQSSKVPSVYFGSNDELKRLRITEVIDIEEMAWAPKYGLKGMIDASIRVREESNGFEANEKIFPLEFKTGKVPNGQSSMEHCAQVILYTLLMSERYKKDISSGLLYYLQSDTTQGITVRRSDVVGLIMRRNELANEVLKASSFQQLPPMLQSPSMCKSCRHLDVCTIYHKAHGGGMESSGLSELFDSHVRHLTAAHCLFLRNWDRLIDLEAKELQLVKNEVWHSKHNRSSGGLSSIVLDASCGIPLKNSLKDNRYIYRFVHQNSTSNHVYASDGDSSIDLPSRKHNMDSALRKGDYVILSTESGHQAIASGIITDISHFHVSVSFSKCLRLPGNSSSEESGLLCEVWRIDKDEFMTSFSVMRFNLLQLFLPNVRSSRLRKMIVDLEAPRFDGGCIFSQDPSVSYILSAKSLNSNQRRAILKMLTAKDYALILGMPGTGKTSTMVHAVKALLMRGASVLLTSYTNSAVDNLLIKLKAQGIDFVRLGRQEVVHEEVRANCFPAMAACSVEEIRLRLDQVKVVAVTCLGVSSPLLANRKFDVCIMDEAGQITLPVSLGPLMLASMFVLVGDHYQLPPLVQSAEARENGMGTSLFCRLSEAHPQAISALQSQYRMCQGIMELSNALIYGDRLHCGSSEVANAKLNFSNFKSCSSWLKEVMHPNKPVIFINTDMLPAFETKDSKTVNNPIEAYIIAKVTKELVNSGIEDADIGIITPYNSQANLIRTTISVASVEINTIDKYQGRDKDCILLSFVRSSENPRSCSSSLLGDWHRINVALTRAKKKLIMVGSCKTLSNVPLLKLLVEKVGEQSGILVVSNEEINYEEHGRELKRCSHIP